MEWVKRSPKVWLAANGEIIADHSLVVGGRKIKMFMNFASQSDFDAGNNYAISESVKSAKQEFLNRKRN